MPKPFWNNLVNHSKDELCDIYWNLVDGVWDRRIGRKPLGFDLLPDTPKRFKRKSKTKELKPYVQQIENLTTQKERRKYLNVVIQKCMSETEFEEYWEKLEWYPLSDRND